MNVRSELRSMDVRRGTVLYLARNENQWETLGVFTLFEGLSESVDFWGIFYARNHISSPSWVRVYVHFGYAKVGKRVRDLGRRTRVAEVIGTPSRFRFIDVHRTQRANIRDPRGHRRSLFSIGSSAFTALENIGERNTVVCDRWLVGGPGYGRCRWNRNGGMSHFSLLRPVPHRRLPPSSRLGQTTLTRIYYHRRGSDTKHDESSPLRRTPSRDALIRRLGLITHFN